MNTMLLTHNLSLAQIEALAPDAASLKAGKGLALPHKWLNPAGSSEALWGECAGSGAKPYRTQVDLREPNPAFKCSCPSRKFPCKHGLGLILLAAHEPKVLSVAEPPDWVSEWLQLRSERQQKAESKKKQALTEAQLRADGLADSASSSDSVLSGAPAKAGSKTSEAEKERKRHANLQAGLEELKLWLEDLVRRGLAHLPAENISYFEQMAARMVDAQAPGLARRVRNLAACVQAGSNWAEKTLEQLGLIQLLVQGYERLDQLDPGLQAEIKNQLGWTLSQETLLQSAPAKDRSLDNWLILGQVFSSDERLRVRRTWLLGLRSGRYALLLDFAFAASPFKQLWTPGQSLEAELVWFPGSWPLRGLVSLVQGEQLPRGPALAELPCFESWQDLRRQRAQALAANPWLEHQAACLADLTPHLQLDSLWLEDSQGVSLPVWPGFEQSWLLLALSGGQPLRLSLESDGERIFPLGVWSEQGYLAFNSLESGGR